MSEMAVREMTAEEWAARLVGASEGELTIALKAMEDRGRRKGRASLAGAVEHLEVAYRYATDSHRPGADKADLLASAETMAKIGYDEWFKERR